jgi:sugar (pentulose or hexulose) kinase
MSSQVYLAVDLGAGSGRVVAGLYDGRSLQIEDVHRFPNTSVHLPTGWHWNLPQLFADIKAGLAAAAKKYGADRLVSLAVDTWGVDYGLIDARGRLLGLPWMYRDSRTDGMVERLTGLLPREEIYHRTGIQFLFFNTLYQLAAEARDHPNIVRDAARLLFTPDLLTFWLSGAQITERTIASTSQLLRAGTAEWDLDLAAKAGIPAHILHPLTEPGTTVGALLPDIAAETGCGAMRVAACGSHDTASAAAGAPARAAEPLFLSSGTWSLIGRELKKPIVSDESLRAGFSNEQGLCDTTRFLKNVAGMWLLQECRKAWEQQGLSASFAQLVQEALAHDTRSLLDPDDECFQKPCDMPAAIADYLRRTGQPLPASSGETTRIILQSLALKYRATVAQLREWMPDLPDTLHIVGGGSQNALLNQMTADATGLRVEAGPVEATAAGNILAQLMAAGEISSLAEGRELLRSSFQPRVFEPGDSETWTERESEFAALQTR